VREVRVGVRERISPKDFEKESISNDLFNKIIHVLIV